MIFKVNGKRLEADPEADEPLLWVLRDHLELTGTKYGCGIGLCGACTVWMDGAAVRACQVRAQTASGAEITTIEGLGDADGSELSPVQQAWIDEQVPQCGYCQPGMIMAVSALLEEDPNPSDEDLDRKLGNLCRCGTYPRIRSAVRRAVSEARKRKLLGGEMPSGTG